MKTVQYQEKDISLPEYYNQFYPNSKLLFFDIETTGFIARNTTLYLIGVLWFENDTAQVLQWFNEDGYSEAELLQTFQDFSKNFTHLVHFNGIGFDLPYLKQKAEQLSIPFDVAESMTQIDIYKEIRAYKKILDLENLKQTTIEKFLRLKRDDTYTGGELINVYQRYVATSDNKLEKLLLLHNHDDLLGMPMISKILNYKAFFEQITPYNIHTTQNTKQLFINFDYDDYAYLPIRILYRDSSVYINANEQHACITITLTNDTLKHYFSDYKNYYYLPNEDMAIHKSVAAFVATANKTKATKNTCYTKKTDVFIPCYDASQTEIFKYHANDKSCYQTLESFLQSDVTKQCRYIQKCLQTLS